MHEHHDPDHHDRPRHPRMSQGTWGILGFACLLACVRTDDVDPAMQLRDGDTETTSDATTEGTSDGTECYCPHGTDYLGNPVESTQCGEIVCGGGHQYYTCGPEGWEFVGGECPPVDPCSGCPSVYDVHGNPIHGASCGDRVCGAGNEYYVCQDGDWIPDGVACGQPSCTTSECPCMDSVVVEGAAETVTELWQDTGITVTAGQTVTIGCGPEAGTISWSGPSLAKTCDGSPLGDVKTWDLSIAPGCRVFSLVAKIGEDGAQHCVEMATSFVATQSGPLYLAFNDGVVASDNEGAWTVDVGLGCVEGDTNDPCMTGIAPAGHTVYADTMAGKSAFHNALLINAAANAITCFELSGAEYLMTATDWIPPPLDLRGAEFRERVDGAEFFGADLRWARFSNTVRNSAFVYANLESADFGAATLVNDDFAFARGIDEATWPASVVNTVFTGESLRSEPMLPHLRIDGQQALVDALLSWDPPHDGLVGSSWRSYIWDHLVEGGWPKARVFDAVDQRYGYWGVEEAPRPAGGPTLHFLNKRMGHEPTAAIIASALGNLVASDEPAYLDDPLIGRVSPGHEGEICAVSREGDALAWYGRLADHHFVWNSVTASRDASEIALQTATLDEIRARLEEGSPARAGFDARATDHLFNLGELAADGLDDDEVAIIEAAFDYFASKC